MERIEELLHELADCDIEGALGEMQRRAIRALGEEEDTANPTVDHDYVVVFRANGTNTLTFHSGSATPKQFEDIKKNASRVGDVFVNGAVYGIVDSDLKRVYNGEAFR